MNDSCHVGCCDDAYGWCSDEYACCGDDCGCRVVVFVIVTSNDKTVVIEWYIRVTNVDEDDIFYAQECGNLKDGGGAEEPMMPTRYPATAANNKPITIITSADTREELKLRVNRL